MPFIISNTFLTILLDSLNITFSFLLREKAETFTSKDDQFF